MPDVHRRAAASAPRLTPEEISTRGFAAAFRGISELEVRNFLKRVADEMTTALEREQALEAQVAELQEQLKHPPVVTEDRLLEALGEETARVLRSAQESAEEIRTRAQEQADTLTADAEAAAAKAREDADADAAAMRDAAQSAAATREQEAEQYSAETRAAADADVAELRERTDAAVAEARADAEAAAAAEIEAAKSAGRDLVNEARAVRERILADLGRRRILLQAQIDELRAGRDRLLDAYRVVKRTLGDATEALVQVEARAATELSGPPPPFDVPPVDGELAALAGELTGESGPVSPDVEALFARLREQSGPAPVAAVPAPEAEPATAPTPEAGPGPDAEPEPEPESESESESESAPEPGPAPVIDLVAEATDEPEIVEVVEVVETVAVVATPESVEVVEVVEIETDRVLVLGPDVSDDAARAGRDDVLGPLRRELGRKVKRALQDEQNDVLDRIRTVKGRPVATDVLPTAAAQAEVVAATLRGPVEAAYRSGRAAAGGSGTGAGAPGSMVEGLASTMVERLHERLVDAIDGAGDDAAVTQRLGARYREFKGQELDAIVGDTLAAAWALGIYDATPAGTTLRWVPDEVGRCPDCDDNALEPTRRGDPFPTGQPHPPAHPGCRCLVVPQS